MTEEEVKKVFGKNIKQLRESKNIKQIDLAAKIGIAHTNLSRVENGKDFVKASTIINLCNILEVEPCVLFKL